MIFFSNPKAILPNESKFNCKYVFILSFVSNEKNKFPYFDNLKLNLKT